MANLLLLNGPNLNLLGTREQHLYGKASLSDLEHKLRQHAAKLGHELQCFQSNAEHALIEQMHQAKQNNINFIIINPAAFTHTSIALRDAMLAVDIPFIEIHISNVYARETFRQQSYLADIAVGTISGFGIYGYELALLAANNYLQEHKKG